MSIDVTEGAPWNEILAMASISILPSIIVFFGSTLLRAGRDQQRNQRLRGNIMAEVIFNKLEKVYSNGFKAVHGIDLKIADGEFMVIVGPSGCAKSTTLRMLAGRRPSAAARCGLGTKSSTTAPKSRGIAMVFQNYALYPHMTVRENLAFGLKLSKLPKAQIDRQVEEAAKILELEELLDRLPRQLSGGGAARGGGPGDRQNRTSSCSTNRSPTLTPSCAPRCGSAFPICISS